MRPFNGAREEKKLEERDWVQVGVVQVGAKELKRLIVCFFVTSFLWEF